MTTITRRQGLAQGSALTVAAALGMPGLARSQGRKVLTGGFDVGPGGFPKNFNPLAATAGFTWFNLYYETLLNYDIGLTRIGPALASAHEPSTDLKTHTFHLVPDAKWQDGEPFTSADVAFTFDLARDSKTGSVFAGRLVDLVGVDTPDPHTAILRLGKASSGVGDLVTRMMMLPKHSLGAVPRDGLDHADWWSKSALGTGPFRFVRYETDQFVELTANPAYRRGKPKLDGVINRYFASTAGAVAAQKAGEIQFTYVEPDDLKTFQADPAARVIDGNSWVVNYLGFNHLTPFWRDLRVRQAVMHAINREAIIKSLLGGNAVLANSGYTADGVVPSGLEPYAYDPAKARALLKDAGWDQIGAGKPLPLITYYNTPLVANMLAAIQAMLGQVGITIVPRLLDVPTFNGITMAREPDVSQFAMTYAGAVDGPEPSSLIPFQHERQIPPNGVNQMRIRMAELNDAFDAASSDPDDSSRKQKWQEVARVQNRMLPWATMWVTKRFGIVSNRVQNFQWTPAPSGGSYDPQAHLWDLT